LLLPTFSSHTPLGQYLLCQGIAFLATVVYGSFFEWTLHRNVMHRKTWISYPFELHAMLHHKIFRHDETYHALNDEMKEHVTFVPRDYVLLLMVNSPIFIAAEALLGLPILIGAWTAVLCYLGMFDLLHWSFHVPKERRLERWFWIRWLKEHHRLHHQYQNRNLNVVFPLADLVFRTRVSRERSAALEAAP
jgi:fatty acid hydroxylase family protein